MNAASPLASHELLDDEKRRSSTPTSASLSKGYRPPERRGARYLTEVPTQARLRTGEYSDLIEQALVVD